MGFKKMKKKILFRKKFSFENFVKSQNFVNRVGEIAENEGHHPDIFWLGICNNQNFNACHSRFVRK